MEYVSASSKPMLAIIPDFWHMPTTQVLEQFPELEAYGDLWPIEKYFTLHRSHERARKKYASLKSPSVTQALPDVVQPDSPKRARVFIGKPPPRHRASSRVCFDQNSASYPYRIPNSCPSLSTTVCIDGVANWLLDINSFRPRS
jgi:hypothetical protein